MWLIELNKEENEEVHEANFWFQSFYILPFHFEMDLNNANVDVIYDVVFSVL